MISKAKKYQLQLEPQAELNPQKELKNPSDKPMELTKENISEEKEKVENEVQNVKAPKMKKNEKIDAQNPMNNPTGMKEISYKSTEDNKGSVVPTSDTEIPEESQGEKIPKPHPSVVNKRSQTNSVGRTVRASKPSAQEKGNTHCKSGYRPSTTSKLRGIRENQKKPKKDKGESMGHYERMMNQHSQFYGHGMRPGKH